MQGEPPTKGSTPTGAVFLSYASEDAAAAEQIAMALRTAGIEIWFDKSELRGGDVWDRMIRQRIRDCALFVPVISRHTQERLEGYFRLEWRLAVDRSQRMAAERAFIVPVVVDSTRDREALVPDYFHEVQLTRLPGGETPPTFVERIKTLLGPKASPAQAAATATAPGPTAGQSPGASLPSARLSRFALGAVGAVVALVIAYFVVDKFWLSKRAAASSTTSATVAGAHAPPVVTEKTIAVLPFVDMSEKHDQGYFSDGLSEELIDMLTRVPDLRVPARTSSFYFKGKSEDIATIAQRLHVAHVLEGSVRKSGNALRVTAQLIRADNGYHLWSETYDRELKDVFKVQDDIAGAVVTALKVHLLPTQFAAQAELRTANIEAYNQYLQGKQSFNRGDTEGYQRAVTAFSAATTLDPRYASAYAALALAQFWLADSKGGDKTRYQSALESASKAVALAPELGAGYAARGFLRAVYSFDFAGGKADLDEAVALSPGDADVLHRSAVVLAIFGNLPAAMLERKKPAS
jgi:TolB-like protein